MKTPSYLDSTDMVGEKTVRQLAETTKKMKELEADISEMLLDLSADDDNKLRVLTEIVDTTRQVTGALEGITEKAEAYRMVAGAPVGDDESLAAETGGPVETMGDDSGEDASEEEDDSPVKPREPYNVQDDAGEVDAEGEEESYDEATYDEAILNINKNLQEAIDGISDEENAWGKRTEPEEAKDNAPGEEKPWWEEYYTALKLTEPDQAEDDTQGESPPAKNKAEGKYWDPKTRPGSTLAVSTVLSGNVILVSDLGLDNDWLQSLSEDGRADVICAERAARILKRQELGG